MPDMHPTLPPEAAVNPDTKPAQSKPTAIHPERSVVKDTIPVTAPPNPVEAAILDSLSKHLEFARSHGMAVTRLRDYMRSVKGNAGISGEDVDWDERTLARYQSNLTCLNILNDMLEAFNIPIEHRGEILSQEIAALWNRKPATNTDPRVTTK